MDGIAKTTKNLDQYITFLNINCKIPFHTFVDKETKHLKWRDLTDSEKVSYLENTRAISYAEKVQQLWDTLQDIYQILWSFKRLDKKDFIIKIKGWINLFTDTSQICHVTPYMHVLVAHIQKFLEVLLFSPNKG